MAVDQMAVDQMVVELMVVELMTVGMQEKNWMRSRCLDCRFYTLLLLLTAH